MREAATIGSRPCKLTFDLLTLKVVSESHVTWATSVPILVFLDFSIHDLGPMYATDRQTSDVRRASSLNAPYSRGEGITMHPAVVNKDDERKMNESKSTKLKDLLNVAPSATITATHFQLPELMSEWANK